MSGAPAPGALWKEARAGDGRVYYYNTVTKATQWTKPEDMMTSQERALTNQPWKEYTTPEGRKYWYNTQTQQSVWTMPEEYRSALQQDIPPPRPAAPAFVAGGSFSSGSHYRDRDDMGMHDRTPHERPTYQSPMEGYRGPAFVPQNEPEYSNPQDAEAAFMKLLKKAGAQADWTWEQVMRATIKDPQYRAIKDPKDRKAAFEKYVLELRAQEKERERERQTKLRADFTTMLRSHPEIKYYTRWTTARAIVEGETIFKNAKTEDERVKLFDEYRNELYKVHLEDEASSRKSAMDELGSILTSLNLEPYTRWSDAQGMIEANERFSGDEKFKTLAKLDVLKAFEAHIKSLERSFNDARQKQKTLKARRERQNRDAFAGLLKDLKRAQKIKAGTKWMDIFPLIEDDPRYVAMVGQGGSTPLDMFWDMVEEEERMLRAKRNDVLDVLEDKRFEITPKTPFEEFATVMQTDRRTANIDSHSMTLIFERLREKVVRRDAEDKDRADRHQRRAVDALRSRIKHLDPYITVNDTWEQVRPRIERFEEYRALESEELRRSAFDKFIRRLKEKDEEIERAREAHDRHRASRRDYRERDRDRDRDSRNGHRRTRTRSPEPDAYEADRKKAQADRERNYRRPSWQARDERDDWGEGYRKHDRSAGRLSSSGHYDSERRQREAERERSYISRADPRQRDVELDYGDSRPASDTTARRRKADDDGDERRDSKRFRRDRSRELTYSPRRHRTRTPQPAPEPAEDPGLKSGSEEGEIEET